MRAWAVHKPGPMATGPLVLLDRPVPEPGPGELLIRVLRCGVCRTDLHLAEGDLPPRRPDVTPVHEGVGEVVQAGQGTASFARGAMASGAAVHVFTRAPASRKLALELGAASAQDSFAPSPEPLDSAIVFAPVGTVVPPALRNLDRGGTVAIAGIYLTDIPALNYEDELFQERNLRSVTSNTRGDAEEFLRLAERLRLKVTVTPYLLEAADQALADLAADRVTGAAVLTVA